MEGIETYNHIMKEIIKQDPNKEHKTIKMGRLFAMDLLKLNVSDIGETAVSQMWQKGLGYFDNSKLFGYNVEFDNKEQGDKILFV